MIQDVKGPFRRAVPLHRVTPAGTEAVVEADGVERAALAADLGLPAIHRLVGRYRLAGSRERVSVKGTVEASIEQTCSVSLENFPSAVREEVDLVFASPVRTAGRDEPTEVELSIEHDPPEDLVGDTIDLGAVTAEYLALGLDPYPRKPGVEFEQPDRVPADSPFAKLGALASEKGEPKK